jgi:hypothetical protein
MNESHTVAIPLPAHKIGNVPHTGMLQDRSGTEEFFLLELKASMKPFDHCIIKISIMQMKNSEKSHRNIQKTLKTPRLFRRKLPVSPGFPE